MAFRNPLNHLPASAITGQINSGQLQDGAVTGPKIGPGAVTTPALGPGAVTANALGSGAVTAPALGTGAVGYQALSVGTGNLVPDPSFEGAYAQTLTSSSWSIDTTGNNSPKSLRVTSAVSSGTKTKDIATIPVMPGEKFYLAVDYQTSADWSGSFVKFYLLLVDSAGATVGFTVAQDAPVPGAAWKRISVLGTVPAGAVTAKIRAEHNGTTIFGSTWFDNAEVRTALVAGAVSAGLITTGMLAAGSVTADRLTANAIDGKTITGASIRVVRPDNTVAAAMLPDLGDGQGGFEVADPGVTKFARLESGQLIFGSPGVAQVLPTGITGTATGGTLDIESGLISGGAQAHIILASSDSPRAPGDGSALISMEWDGAGTADMVVDIAGILSPRNFAWGHVSITPVANVPTSVTVTGLRPGGVRGNTFTGFATANSVEAGRQVTGVGITAITATAATVWVTRTVATATNVYWAVLGDK